MKKIQVTVTLPNEKECDTIPEYHFCYQCKHFTRHYILNSCGRFNALDFGHCYPPKKYSHVKYHKTTDFACMFFEQR